MGRGGPLSPVNPVEALTCPSSLSRGRPSEPAEWERKDAQAPIGCPPPPPHPFTCIQVCSCVWRAAEEAPCPLGK